LISLLEPVVLRRLKLLKYFRKVNLSPEETLALMHRVETNSCWAKDYEVLIKIVQAHTEMSSDLMEESPILAGSLPERQAKRKRQAAKASRRRRRR
jgi:hypothetical protein